jgi:hypothetical protein
MSTRDLRAKYGGTYTGRNLINKAIRTELVGGDRCLDALANLDQLAHMWRERGWVNGLDQIEIARDAVAELARSMRAEIRRRYNMPPEQA